MTTQLLVTPLELRLMNEVEVEEIVELIGSDYSEYCEKEKFPEKFTIQDLEKIASIFKYSPTRLIKHCIVSATISENRNGGLTTEPFNDTV